MRDGSEPQRPLAAQLADRSAEQLVGGESTQKLRVVSLERQHLLQPFQPFLAQGSERDCTVRFLPTRCPLQPAAELEQADQDAAVEAARGVADEARGFAQRERPSRSDEVLDHAGHHTAGDG